MQAVFNLLARLECPMLIIGGHALEAHGVARQTVDVDCLIVEKDRDAVDDLLRGGGYVLQGSTENFARYTHPSPALPEVDLLFVDEPVFEKLLAAAIPLRRGSREFRVPSLTHLIALKLHAMRNDSQREARDLGDIVELLRANPGVVAAVELNELCARFGSADVAQKLAASLPQ